MGDLKDLYEKQVKLQERIGCQLEFLTDQGKEKWTKENILAIHAELGELLEWINWKHWKKTKVEYTPERIMELQMEIIDIFHFWLNLCIIWGMTPDKIVGHYYEKNKINHERQNSGY